MMRLPLLECCQLVVMPVLANQGLDLFKCMIEDFAIEPLTEHHSCLVDLLGRMSWLEGLWCILISAGNEK